MPVRREVFLQNGIYHVYNRGNARRVVFKAKEDYERFLNRLKEFSASHEVAVLGYCLMPNHFHLLLMQVGEISLGEMMRKLLLAYAMYFNLKYDNVGSVFQGRFKAKMVGEDEYLLQVLRYIHQNPWELVQVKSPPRPRLRRAGGTWPGLKSYRWSSYPVYLGLKKEDWVQSDVVLDYYSSSKGKVKDLRQFTEEPLNDQDRESLKGVIFE